MSQNLVSICLGILLSAASLFSAEKPGAPVSFDLNPQDVPIFYDNNPLTGLKSFTVITTLPFKEAGMQTRINSIIEKTLETVGAVTHVQDNDMRRFGTGNVLLIQMGNVTEWNGTETPLVRLSLSIETTVTLEKTGEKIFPMVWSINTFLQGSVDAKAQGALTKAMQKLIGDFVQSYQSANPGQGGRPVFYYYN